MTPAVRRGRREALAEWLRRPRYELIPLPGVADRAVADVPSEVKVTVTASPTRGLEPTLALCEKLVARGYDVVPHLSARAIVDSSHLEDVLARVEAAGITEVFAIAGDAEEPAGAYVGALDLLRAMSEIGHNFKDIGITGYPESHPFIDDDVTIQSMWDKRRYATYIVSNICFDARVIARWVARVRRRGVELPIFIGLPSVTDTNQLLRVSQKIGVGDSARFLRKNRNWLLRLVVPGAYTPGRLLERLAPELARPEAKVAGLHLYTFNHLRKTEAWRQKMLNKLAPA